jgi:TonB family protein
MQRSRQREFRLRWCVLLSALLHILGGVALHLILTPAGGPHLPREHPTFRVFLSHTDQVGESLQAEVSPEIPYPGQRSDGFKAYDLPESEADVGAQEARVFDQAMVQHGEPPKPPDPRPPTAMAPQSIPPISPARPPVTERRQDTNPKRVPASQPKVHPPVDKRPEAQQFAGRPESAVDKLAEFPDQDHERDSSAGQAPRPPGHGQGPRFGRVPLLSSDELDKYAKLPVSEPTRSSRPLSGVDTVISLNTKDVRYLAYFAHIKERIERAWSYPSEAVAKQLHGQLLLFFVFFVLQHSGHVKRVELLRSSGSHLLDRGAWDAVINASPFDPFPSQIAQEELHIRARFSYVLEPDQRQTTVQ